MNSLLKERLWHFFIIFLTLIGTIYIYTSFILEYIDNNVFFKEKFYNFFKSSGNSFDLKNIIIFSILSLFVIIFIEITVNTFILRVLKIKIDKIKFILAFLIINGLTSLINIIMLYLFHPSAKFAVFYYLLATFIINFLIFYEDLGNEKNKYIKFQFFIFLLTSFLIYIV